MIPSEAQMIRWNVDPEIFNIGNFALRWYGVLFAAAFITGFEVIKRIFIREKVSEKHLDRLLIYTIVSTVLGARLGHTLFYEPEIYLANPLRILKVWEGGLASHGAAITIPLAFYVFARKYNFSWLWILDRVAIITALAGGFIRTGNLFNSEIIGKPTDVPWAFIFERVSPLPRHPSQIYEAVAYFAIFGALRALYEKPRLRNSPGFLFGFFLITVFGVRFLIEFLKEHQVAFEASLPLDMGQLLSIPLVLLGFWLVIRALARESKTPEPQGKPFPRKKGA